MNLLDTPKSPKPPKALFSRRLLAAGLFGMAMTAAVAAGSPAAAPSAPEPRADRDDHAALRAPAAGVRATHEDRADDADEATDEADDEHGDQHGDQHASDD